jgi:hypothetical protein
MVWNKENLINIGFSRLQDDWKYVAWIDADVNFRREHWASETVHALQHYDIIQPWADCYDLGPHGEHLQHHRGFCRQFFDGHPVAADRWKFWTFNGGPYCYPHSGYAWAARRQTIEWLGGLIDIGALGAGDHHMALALVGKAQYSVPKGISAAYLRHVMQWQGRAIHHVNYNVGYVPGTIEHNWHGRKTDRKYVDRWEILVKNDFNPDTDLKKNSYGVVELAGNKPNLTRDIDHYFRQRNEDANSID